MVPPRMMSQAESNIHVVGPPPKPYTFMRWNSMWSGRIVTNSAFKRTVIFLIAFDSLLLGVETFVPSDGYPELHLILSILNYTFLSFFTMELVLQFLHRRWSFFKDGTRLFDTLIVGASWFFSFLLVVRTFRVVRALRLATKVHELRNLVLSVSRVLPNMLAILFVLLLLLYVNAVLFTDLFGDLYERGLTSVDYFSRLDVAARTLFQIMTLDEWADIQAEVLAVYWWAWIPFMTFITATSFFLLNLGVSVACEAVLYVHQQQNPDHQLLQEVSQANTQALSIEIRILEKKVDRLTKLLERHLGPIPTTMYNNDDDDDNHNNQGGGHDDDSLHHGSSRSLTEELRSNDGATPADSVLS